MDPNLKLVELSLGADLDDDDSLTSSSFPFDSSDLILDTTYNYSTTDNNSFIEDYNDFNNNTGNVTYVHATIHFSLGFQILIYIIYNSVFIAALLGNTLVCYVVFSSPRMRTVTNYLIANLAIGDLLMALLCVPFSYISVLLQYWPFGEVLCHLVAPAQAVCVFVSAYTLVALAADRYIAILYPLRPRLRRSQAIIVIFMVWAVAILTAVPIAVYTKLKYNEQNGLPECSEDWTDQTNRLVYSLTLMILQYFFPLAVLVFTYARIAVAVWGKRAPGEAEDGRDQRLAKAKRKMIKMMVTVVIVYTICWLPFNSVVVYGDLDDSLWDWPYIYYIYPLLYWLALAHTVCNPIIYCWMNSRFRAGFRSAIANVPLLNRLTRRIGLHGRGSYYQQEFQLHRMNTTCTTYTFHSHGGGKYGGGGGGRNSSVLSSNGRNGSVTSYQRHNNRANSSVTDSTIIEGSSSRGRISHPLRPTSTTNDNGNSYYYSNNNKNHQHRNGDIQIDSNSNTPRNSICSFNNRAMATVTSTNCEGSPMNSSARTSLLLPSIATTSSSSARGGRRKKSFGRNKFSRQDSESFM